MGGSLRNKNKNYTLAGGAFWEAGKLSCHQDTRSPWDAVGSRQRVYAVLSHSVVSNPLQPRGLQPTRLLCPWDSPGKNAGVGCHFLLQGTFLTQGSNPSVLHWQADSSPQSHQGSPYLHKLLLLFNEQPGFLFFSLCINHTHIHCWRTSEHFVFLFILFLMRQVQIKQQSPRK